MVARRHIHLQADMPERKLQCEKMFF